MEFCYTTKGGKNVSFPESWAISLQDYIVSSTVCTIIKLNSHDARNSSINIESSDYNNILIIMVKWNNWSCNKYTEPANSRALGGSARKTRDCSAPKPLLVLQDKAFFDTAVWTSARLFAPRP